MSDLTSVPMQQCRNVECKDPKWIHQGGCWPYLRSRKGHEYGTCKHVCQWHEQWSPERQTEAQKRDRICPRCGGPTNVVMVGV